jgi:hypothetical protein
MRSVINAQLARSVPPNLVDELLESYSEAKRNFYLGGHRLSAVEGGRFCEAAFRVLEHAAFGSYTALGTSLDTDKLIHRLANIPKGVQSDSIRLHIPRALRVVYDIRNNRDAAHLADGIDPNIQDATLVTGTIDWVLAEMIRPFHKCSANEAQAIVEQLVTRTAPVIQDFNGFLKVLNPDLPASDHCLVLLYHRGVQGATFEELRNWVRPAMRGNLRRTLTSLTEGKDLVHDDGQLYSITRLGIKDVEDRRLIEPA